MNKIILLTILFFVTLKLHAQSIDELKAMKAEQSGIANDLQSQLDATNAKIADLQSQIDKLSGWRTGLNGLVGFDFNKSNNWISNPNPNAKSSALNISLTAYANNDKEKAFLHNKLLATKSWQDVDLVDGSDNGNLFDNGTVDILNLSSLAGYKLSDKFALSGLGELNTSIENLLDPGTIDIGVGVTWLPIENMTVVIHPLNYNIAFSGVEGVETTGSIGAKLRVDYARDFLISNKKFAWSTTLTSFIPYSNEKQTITFDDGTIFEAGQFNYTWLNTINFEIWKGIGVGVGFGIRKSDFEFADLQSYYSLGLSYGF